MKIRSVAVLGAGAVGAYFVYGLTGKEDIDFCVVASGARKERLERDGITIDDKKEVRTFRPAENSISALSMTATFSICSISSIPFSLNQRIELILCKKSSALSVSLNSRKAVSSPAIVPASFSTFILSNAEQAAPANPGSVLITIMFCA